MVDHFRPVRFSRTGIQGLKVSATLSINDRVNRMREDGETVFHLAFGESRFPVHPRLAEALAGSVNHRSYVPARGTRHLREAVAGHYDRHYGWNVDPDRILVGPGSKALIFAAMKTLGDEVILQRPSWVTYAPLARLLGKPITWVETSPDDGFQWDPTALHESVDASRQGLGNPDLMVFNNPGNPTGTVHDPQRIGGLADVCRGEQLVVLSDEIYARTTFSGSPFMPFADAYPEGTVTFGGLSKDLSLGGWRIGVALVPDTEAGARLAEAMAAVATNIWSCVPAPIQEAAAVAYSGVPEIEEYVVLCARMHEARTRHLHGILQSLGVPCAPPSGGFYLFPSFEPWAAALRKKGVRDDRALATYLLENHRLATLPGTAFNQPYGFHLRLSSSFLDVSDDARAEQLVEAFRADSDPTRFIADHHTEIHEVGERFTAFIQELNS